MGRTKVCKLINDMNVRRIFCIVSIFCFIASSLAENSIEYLNREGARIGRYFKKATQEGNVEGQNIALLQMDSILSTLKKQEQVDALTNAFNNCNVEITVPKNDAILYMRALGNALVAHDDIGAEDAKDIIENVKQQYKTKSVDEYNAFEKYLKAADAGILLGIAKRNASSEELSEIKNQESAIKTTYENDGELLDVFVSICGFFSTKITDIDSDADLCASKILEAQKSGKQELIDEAKKEVVYMYEHYLLEQGEDVATLFDKKVNEILLTTK